MRIGELKPASTILQVVDRSTRKPKGILEDVIVKVATSLLADRPLPDDGLFVDQLEMIYSMDSRSFYRESFSNLVAMLHESR
ncbi:unnamed protein product [Spirodela intermedia]|uniref:Uncharacterized protein n=1 Tax=Spirodela intermedia TaxID=51605 RepID=A0A7I8J594_SPIIN|nr:unnamed protein product [Spirodela intermedia]CAA2634849.1 unnamed protein product [Spirodela intermedia]CAA6665271.1 unnamed protein product [Spirodela intermedia]CAA6673822.1 unnamed protein product [Spirodela intermedia]